MNKLVSIDLYSDFGCLKKPDTNDPVYLTFNMLHKPALLGILGAIAGLEGFSEPPPRSKKLKGKNRSLEQEPKPIVATYYEALKTFKTGVRPLQHENGNFSKTILTYNNGVGYANIQANGPTNLMVTEQMLIAPAYRCFILFENEDAVSRKLFDNLKNKDAEYLPYLGKNEFSAWWKDWRVYDFQKFVPGEKSFEVHSIFIKEEPVKDGKSRQPYKISGIPSFMYFENLPIGYGEQPMQYDYSTFAFTNCQLKQEYPIEHLYLLTDTEPNEIVQLF